MASTYLTRTPSSDGNVDKFTFSFWIKRSQLGVQQKFLFAGDTGSNQHQLLFTAGDLLQFEYYDGTNNYYLRPNRVFRDTSAWYHIVAVWDTGNATSADRIKLYVNGTRETSFSAEAQPTQNFDGFWNDATYTNYIGRQASASQYFDGLMTHIHLTDGYAYDADTFGQFNSDGVWTPKTSPSVTYGTNGFFLKMENSGSMGTDSSGNANNFTVNGNLTQTIDSPSNVYCTMNPLDHIKGTFTNGNLAMECVTDAGDSSTRGTLAFTKGKWYWEAKYTAFTGSGATATFIGIQDTSTAMATSGATNGYWYNVEVGAIAHNSTNIVTGLSTFSAGNIVGVGYDADNGDLYLWTNGVAENSGSPVVTGIDTSTTWAPFFCIHYGASNTSQWFPNFGNGYFGTTAVSSAGSNGNGSIFEYDVPTGYYALNTKNLATYG